jgi:hypothetical protein
MDWQTLLIAFCVISEGITVLFFLIWEIGRAKIIIETAYFLPKQSFLELLGCKKDRKAKRMKAEAEALKAAEEKKQRKYGKIIFLNF